MRVSSYLLPLLSVLAPAVLADGETSTSCVSTMTSTRTVMKVVTETHTGHEPSSTKAAASVSLVSQAPSSSNGTASHVPTATSPSASKPPVNTDIPGAAGQMAIPQIAVGVIAAGAGLLFL